MTASPSLAHPMDAERERREARLLNHLALARGVAAGEPGLGPSLIKTVGRMGVRSSASAPPLRGAGH